MRKTIDPLTAKLKESIKLENDKRKRKLSKQCVSFISSVKGFLGFKTKN